MKPEAIILAAGFSSRMGRFKPALDLAGKPLIIRCLEPMYDYCSRIYVVGGHNVDLLAPILASYPKITLTYNPNYHAGMFSSVKHGLKQITSDRFFLTPGDYPLVNSQTYQALLNIEANIVVPTYQGRSGHPLLLNRLVIEAILNDPQLKTLKDYIYSQPRELIEVDDIGIRRDIDTIADYQEMLKTFDGNAIANNA